MGAEATDIVIGSLKEVIRMSNIVHRCTRSFGAFSVWFLDVLTNNSVNWYSSKDFDIITH